MQNSSTGVETLFNILTPNNIVVVNKKSVFHIHNINLNMYLVYLATSSYQT